MGLLVKDIVQKNPLVVDKDELVGNAKKLMFINKLKNVLVMDGKKVIGVLTNDDFVKELDMGVSAGEFVSGREKDLITVSEDTSLKEAAQFLVSNQLEILPVLDKNGNVIGTISPSDIVKDFVTTEEKVMSPEMAVVYLAMTQKREEEIYWFDKIKKMGYKAAVTQVGANAIELPLKLREAAIVAAIAKSVISEELKEKNAVSNAVRDLYAQIDLINRGLGGGFKLAIIRGKDLVSVAAYGKCGHALGSGPDHIFMGYSII